MGGRERGRARAWEALRGSRRYEGSRARRRTGLSLQLADHYAQVELGDGRFLCVGGKREGREV